MARRGIETKSAARRRAVAGLVTAVVAVIAGVSAVRDRLEKPGAAA